MVTPSLDSVSSDRASSMKSHGADAPPERLVRTSEGGQLAKGDNALVPGESGGDRASRARDTVGVCQLQAALRHPPPPFRQNSPPIRLRAVLAGEHLRARPPHLSVLQETVSDSG